MCDKDIEKLIEKRAQKCAGEKSNTPPLLYFADIVKRVKKQEERHMNRQFAAFIAAAVFIAAAAASLLTNAVGILALQAVPLILFLIISMLSWKKEAGR